MKLKKLLLSIFMSFCCISTVKAQALPDFTGLVEDLMPTVVSITIEIDLPVDELDLVDLDSNKTFSTGSGFIISSDGYIVTNKHVIDNASKIKVSTNDSQTYEATIVGVDDKTDLALLKLVAKGEWKYVTFGDSDNIKVGEWILAIGNPFGLGSTVTKGIISAKSRDIDSGNYDNFIQTDAAINRGNSGGPLFNMKGEVIGINTAIFSTTGTNMGINFAIPMNLAKWVINQLKENGEVKRGWIGVKIQSNINQISENIKAIENKGVIVSGLTDGGSAQKSGIRVGDIILNIDDYDIDNTKNLSRIIAETPIGKKSKIKIYRNGKPIALETTIEEMPKDKKEHKDSEKPQNDGLNFIPEIGISLDKISNNDNSGLVVTGVNTGYDAHKKGLSIGDIIVKIDKKNIFSIEDVRNHINDAIMENNRPILLQIQNNDATHFVAIELKK